MKILFLISFVLYDLIAIPVLAQCRYLHIGNDDVLKLCDTKNTTPALNVQVGDTIYYANMTTQDVTINSQTQRKLKAQYGNTIYHLYDGAESLQCNVNSGFYDLGIGQCIDKSIEGTNYGYKNLDASASSVKNTPCGQLTENGSWCATFDYGIMKGISSCYTRSGKSNKAADDALNASIDNASRNDGTWCWCKMTEIDGHQVISKWTFRASEGSSCTTNCAGGCGDRLRGNAAMRSGVFGSVAN